MIGGLVSNMRLRSGCRKHWLTDENATPLISELMRSARAKKHVIMSDMRAQCTRAAGKDMSIYPAGPT